MRTVCTATPISIDAIPQFCDTCVVLCDAAGRVAHQPAADLTHLVKSCGPYRTGEYLFHRGGVADSLFVVRHGAVKLCYVDADGRERVGAFYLPGDVVGLRAIDTGRFPYDAVALDTTYVCRYSLSSIGSLATQQPAVQRHLFYLFGCELRISYALAADHDAETRVAAFLVRLGERYARCGQSATAFRLRMSRADIGSYLRLATETVSRVLTRFRERRMIRLRARSVELLAPEHLRATGKALLTY